LVALRPGPAENGPESWESFDRACRPFPGEVEDWPAEGEAERSFRMSRAELARAPAAEEAWAELVEVLGARPVVVADAEAFEAWRAHFRKGRAARIPVIGVGEMSALLFPGRGGANGSEAVESRALHSALVENARRFLAQDAGVLRLASTGLAR